MMDVSMNSINNIFEHENVSFRIFHGSGIIPSTKTQQQLHLWVYLLHVDKLFDVAQVLVQPGVMEGYVVGDRVQHRESVHEVGAKKRVNILHSELPIS